jgi:predicted outer membrane lipoprotein
LQFALTLATLAAAAFIAVNALNLDVDDILDAAKSKK